jgi:hypothetical protein
MKFTTTQPADPGTEFAPDCFAGNVGKQVPMDLGGRTVTATITAVKTSDSGRSVDITYEIPDDDPSARRLTGFGLQGISIDGDRP